MRKNLAAYLNNLITAIIIGFVAITPLIFAPFFTEYFEMPKIALLMIVVLVLAILWSFTWVLEGKVILTKTPLDLALLLLLVVVLISTFLSDTRYVSIYGSFPKVDGSATTWVAYILFYFISASHLRTMAQVKTVFYALLGSTLIVSVVSLLSYFGIYLPLPFAQTANFNPAGSSFSAAALMVLMLPFALVSIVRANKLLQTPAALALATLFTITIGLIGTNTDSNWTVLLSPALIATYVAFGISFLIAKNKQNLPLLGVPMLGLLLVLALGYLPFLSANPLAQKRINFPRELQLPLNTSWEVSGKSFVASPFIGSGPSTYQFNFTQFKPAAFNLTKFWNVRFDTSYNQYLQVLATLGGLGLLALVFFSIASLIAGWTGITHKDSNNLTVALSISGILSIVLLAVHSSTPVTMIALLVILAMLMAIHKSTTGKVEELTLGIKASRISDSNLIVGDILPIILFIPIIILSLIALWQVTTTIGADFQHRMALDAASKRGLDTYNHLVAAEQLNKYIDLYHLDLAQTNFALANAIAAAKGPTEASAGGSLTDQDKQTIQTLLSQSIQEARSATALSPRSAQNWEVLASIYRQISGVAKNALDYSLDSYGRAIQQDPYNPALRLNVGGVYYSAKNYDLAIRFFSDAVNLKPDYANAYYNLAIAARDKGDLTMAKAAAEKVVQLLQANPDSQDYKTAAEFLTTINDKIAANPVTPPAAAQDGALQQSNLPNLLDNQLDTKPEPATPAAVKKNPQATLPTTTPSASANPSPSASTNP